MNSDSNPYSPPREQTKLVGRVSFAYFLVALDCLSVLDSLVESVVMGSRFISSAEAEAVLVYGFVQLFSVLFPVAAAVAILQRWRVRWILQIIALAIIGVQIGSYWYLFFPGSSP